MLPSDIADFSSIIDVRTPAEYEESHIPHALNFPVLKNTERQLVGTLYKKSSFNGKKMGTVYILQNILTHFSEYFIHQNNNWNALVYCWRGGNRSHALATVLKNIGWKVEKLEGGYKNYRQWVRHGLENSKNFNFFYVTVCGLTGSGKSVVLQQLKKNGEQVIDLEALANHRGSHFGILGKQPSQKMFENLIWEKIELFKNNKPVFVEAESRKIGNLTIPLQLLIALRNGHCIELQCTLEERIQFLINEYPQLLKNEKLFLNACQKIRYFIGNTYTDECINFYKSQQYHSLLEILLTQFYDPCYKRAMQKNMKKFYNTHKIYLNPNNDSELSVVTEAIIQFLNKNPLLIEY